jgi:hypothetical protein
MSVTAREFANGLGAKEVEPEHQEASTRQAVADRLFMHFNHDDLLFANPSRTPVASTFSKHPRERTAMIGIKIVI